MFFTCVRGACPHQSGVFDRILGRTLSLFRGNQQQQQHNGDWETVLIGVLGVRGSGKTRILRVCACLFLSTMCCFTVVARVFRTFSGGAG